MKECLKGREAEKQEIFLAEKERLSEQKWKIFWEGVLRR